MNRLLVLLCMPLFNAALIEAAFADAAPKDCVVHSRGDTSLEDEVGRIFVDVSALLVRKCINRRTMVKTYYAIPAPPARSVDGVCHFTERRVFRKTSPKEGWSLEDLNGGQEVYNYMFKSREHGECPPVASKNYSFVSNISLGLYAEFIDFLQAILQSDKTLSDAFASEDKKNRNSFMADVQALRMTGRTVILSSAVLGQKSNESRYQLYIEAQNSWRLTLDRLEGQLRIFSIDAYQ